MTLRFVITLVMFTLFAALVVRCGDSDGAPSTPAAGASAAANRTSPCAQIASTRESLGEVRSNLVPFNEAGLQQAQQKVRANVDSLATTSQRSGGAGSDELDSLVRSIQEFQRLLAQPDLAASLPQIRAQVDAISSDLDSLEDAADCPS